MSDDPIRALARANPFPNDAPVALPGVAVAPTHGFAHGGWAQRVVVAASLALGASLGWGLIATIIDPAAARPNRCVIVGGQVVEAKGVCIASEP